MREGALDLAVDWIAATEDRFVNRKLFEDGLVIVARHGHPRAFKGMGWRDLAKEEFVRCHRRAPERRPKVLQGKLWDLMADGRLIVSEYLEVPFTVSRTDCLGVLPRSMARIAGEEFRMIVTDVPGPRSASRSGLSGTKVVAGTPAMPGCAPRGARGAGGRGGCRPDAYSLTAK